MTGFWAGRRVMVTGGAGFLGTTVVRRLREPGTTEIFVPLVEDYDLRKLHDIDRALAHGRPDLVIHLATVVGGIGANRENPGRFFYEDAIMGVHLMEQSRVTGVAKFVAIGTVCAYQPRRTLDTGRAREALRFVAETSFEDRLRATIEWYEPQRGAGS